MTDLRTKESLLRALAESSAKPLSAAQIHNQRVSFIMGSLRDDSAVTRERVERELAREEGSGSK